MSYQYLQKKNNAKSILANTIQATNTSCMVASASTFPGSGSFICTIWNKTTYPNPGDDPNMEIVLVTAVSGSTFTITRAQESTTASVHVTGSNIELLFTVGQIVEIQNTINSIGLFPGTVTSVSSPYTIQNGTFALMPGWDSDFYSFKAVFTQQNGPYNLVAMSIGYVFYVYAIGSDGVNNVAFPISYAQSFTDDGSNNRYRINISWNPVPLATSYEIDIEISESGFPSFYKTVSSDVTSVVFNGPDSTWLSSGNFPGGPANSYSNQDIITANDALYVMGCVGIGTTYTIMPMDDTAETTRPFLVIRQADDNYSSGTYTLPLDNALVIQDEYGDATLYRSYEIQELLTDNSTSAFIPGAFSIQGYGGSLTIGASGDDSSVCNCRIKFICDRLSAFQLNTFNTLITEGGVIGGFLRLYNTFAFGIDPGAYLNGFNIFFAGSQDQYIGILPRPSVGLFNDTSQVNAALHFAGGKACWGTVASVNVNNIAGLYFVGDKIGVIGGNNDCIIEVDSITPLFPGNGFGTILTYSMVQAGTGYTTGSNLSGYKFSNNNFGTYVDETFDIVVNDPSIYNDVDAPGGDIYIDAGDSTGYASSNIIFRTATPSSSGLPGYTPNLTSEKWRIDGNGQLIAAEGSNIILGHTTGTKIGTSLNQKLAFWNKTPITRPTTGGVSAQFIASAGTTLNSNSTFDGYTLPQIVRALRNLGLLA